MSQSERNREREPKRGRAIERTEGATGDGAPRRVDPRHLGRIVVHAPNWLGDAVMAFPLIEAIRSVCPAASIAVVARPLLAPLFDSHPHVSDVLLLDRFGGRSRAAEPLTFVRTLRRRAFDAAFILPVGIEFALYHFFARVGIRIGYAFDRRGFLLTHALRPTPGFRARHLAESYVSLARVLGASPLPVSDIRMPAPAGGGLLKRFELEDARPRVVLHVWATYGPAKRWPLERFAELGRRLVASHGAQVVLIGGEDAREAGRAVRGRMGGGAHDWCGRTSLPELVELLSASSLVVSADSGPAHLAAALGVPVLALFGSSSPRWTRPLGPHAEVVYRGLECSPCFEATCPLGTTACFGEIGVDEVWTRAVRILDSTPGAYPPCGGRS